MRKWQMHYFTRISIHYSVVIAYKLSQLLEIHVPPHKSFIVLCTYLPLSLTTISYHCFLAM